VSGRTGRSGDSSRFSRRVARLVRSAASHARKLIAGRRVPHTKQCATATARCCARSGGTPVPCSRWRYSAAANEQQKARRAAQDEQAEQAAQAEQITQTKQEVPDEVSFVGGVFNLTGEAVDAPPQRFTEDEQWGACVACKWPVDRLPEHRTCCLATCLKPGCGAEMCIHCWQLVRCHLRCHCAK
jgi:hypothetical protein